MASLILRILGDPSGANKALDTVVVKSKDSFSKVKVAGAALAGGALATMFKGMVDGASDLNETMSKSKIIFGQNASAMDAWSDTAATSLGLSKQAALESASSFGDMFGQLGIVGDQAADMSKKVVKMAADFGSFNNLPTAEVADMISSAFRGEYDSLQRVIPNINAARVEQEAMNLGLLKGAVDQRALSQARVAAGLAERKYADAVREHGRESEEATRAGLALSKAQDAVAKASKGAKGELTEQAKAQAIMSILQKDGVRAADDFAETSGGLANQQKILAAQLADTRAEIGAKLLPMFVGFVRFLNEKAVPAIMSVVDWVVENQTTVKVLAASVATLWVAWKGYKVLSAVGSAVGGLKLSFAAAGGLNPALTAMGVAAGVAFGIWAKHQATIARRKQAIEELTEAVLRDNGALKENSRQTIINQAEKDGLFRDANKLGISVATLTQALLGDANAQRQVNAQLGPAQSGVQGLNQKILELIPGQQKSWTMNEGWAKSENAVRDAVNGANPKIAQATQNAKNVADATAAASGKTDGLKGSLDKLPKNRSVTFSTPGLNQAVNSASALLGIIQSISNKAYVAPTFSAGPGLTTLPGVARASGGSVVAGYTYKINEFGTESFVAPMDGRVLTATQTAAMASGGGHSTVIYLQVDALDPKAAQTAVVSALEGYVGQGGTVTISRGVR